MTSVGGEGGAPPLLTLDLRSPADALLAHRRTREVGRLLGLEDDPGARLAAAVAAVAGSALAEPDDCDGASGATLVLEVERAPGREALIARVAALPRAWASGKANGQERGPALLRPLVAALDVVPDADGCLTVVLRQHLPPGTGLHAAASAPLADDGVGDESVVVLDQLARREREISRLQAEIEQTNRGVVALYHELAEANETLATVVEASPLAIVAVGAGGAVERWNRAAERIFGRPADLALGQAPAALAEALPGDWWADLVGDGSGGGVERERTVRRADGGRRDLAVSAAPLHDATGAVRGRMAVIADITERRLSEQERARSLAREQALRAEAEAAAARLRELQFVTDAALAHLTLEDLLAELLTRIRVALEADAVAVFLLSEDGRELAVRASVGLDEEIAGQLRLPAARDEGGRLAIPREPFAAGGPEDRVRSLAGVPLLVGGREVGVLHVGARGARDFRGEDLRLLQLVADRVALAIEHVRLLEAERHARRGAERTAERVAALQAVTAALSAAMTSDTLVATVLDQAVSTLAARAASVEILDVARGELHLTGSVGYPPDLVARWRRLPVNADVPICEAVRRREAVLIASRDELARRYPHLANEGGDRERSLAALPLVVEGRPLGAIGLTFPGARSFDDDERAFMRALADVCAQALERSRLLEAERAARQDSERARERLTLLADASAVLSSSLDFERTLPKLLRLLVPRVADVGFIELLENDGRLRRAASAHADPEREVVLDEIARRFPPVMRSDLLVPSVVRTGSPVLVPEVGEEWLAGIARGDEHIELVRRAGAPRSALVVPLIARGRTLGAVMLAQVDSDRRFDRADLALVEDLGRRAALAIDNARLFADRSRVARTLQQSLLPHALPDIPGVEVGAAYRPAGGGSDVGGDFYDVFEIAGGSWVCVMGDVCGKGADAAALTGLVRYTVRATAMRERDPATVLTLLNEAVLRQTSDYRFATVLCGRLDADAGAVRFTLACGGHPLPLLVPAEGRARAVGTPGSLIGALPEIVVRDEVVRLEPGDTVVLFTDGVTEERRVSGEAFGEDGLLRVLDATRGRPAAEIAASVERAVLEFSAEEPRDDIAVLVLRVTPPGPAPASRPLP